MLIDQDEFLDYVQAGNVVVPTAGKTWFGLVAPLVQQAIEKFVGFRIDQTSYTEFQPSADAYFRVDDESRLISYDLVAGRVIPFVRGNRALSYLSLANTPVRSITSVYENASAWLTGAAGGDWPADALLPAASYRLDLDAAGISRTGLLVRTAGIWPSESRAVKVTYVAGYTAVEIVASFGPIRLAMLKALAGEYAKSVMVSRAAAAGGPVGSVTIEDFSVTFMNSAKWLSALGAYHLPPEAVQQLEGYVNYAAYVGR